MITQIKNKLRNNQLAKDSFWALCGSILGKGLALVAGILVARFLGKDGFGEYGVIKNTLITIGMFSTFGLGYTATKYIAEYRNEHKNKIPALSKLLVQISLITSSIIGILSFLFAQQLAILIKAEHLANAIKLCSIIIVFNALTLTQISVLAGLGKYKIIAKNNTCSGIITFFVSFILTYKYGFTGALWALLISQAFNCCINAFSIRSEHKKIENAISVLPNSISLIREIISFSFPVALQESLVFIFTWLNTYILIYFTNYGEIGLYSASTQWNVILLFIPGVLRNVTLSHLANASNDKSSHEKIMFSMLIVNLCCTSFLYICVLMICHWAPIFYGETYVGIEYLIALSSASTIFNSMSDVLVQEFMSLNKNWVILSLRVAKDIIAASSVMYLIYYIGISGAMSMAVVAVASSIVYFIFLLLFYRRMNSQNLK